MRNLAVFLAFVSIVLLLPQQPLAAAPLPPDLVVNHETKECAEVSGGDECMACYAPEACVRHLEIEVVSDFYRKQFIRGRSNQKVSGFTSYRPLNFVEKLRVFGAVVRKNDHAGGVQHAWRVRDQGG